MKRLLSLSFGLAALSLSACGLRGDLERPEPLWGDPEPIEELETEDANLRPRTEEENIRLAGTSYIDPVTGETVWVQNEGGGYAPLPSPTTEIEEGDLPPITE